MCRISRIGIYILPLAAGNFLGPLLLGRLFDTVGRKPMIVGDIWPVWLHADCCGGAVRKWRPWPLDADLLLDRDFYRIGGSKFGYPHGERDFPSGDARNGYCCVLCARHAVRRRYWPIPVGQLIGTGSEWAVAGGYVGAAALMIGAAVCEAFFGIEAAGKSLEDVARPLSSGS